MVLLVNDPLPDYMVVIPLLYVGFFVMVLLAVAVSRARKPPPPNNTPRGHGSRPSGKRSPKNDEDVWLAAYLSEVHREQYHGRR